jgi:hypothetical protein
MMQARREHKLEDHPKKNGRSPGIAMTKKKKQKHHQNVLTSIIGNEDNKAMLPEDIQKNAQN